MKTQAIFAIIFVLYSSNVSGFGRSKQGKCPPLTGNENCAAQLLDSEYESNLCSASGQDFECPGSEKCCDDGCDGFACKPAIGLPPLPVIEPHCISAEVRAGDQCEPANVTYCYANQCNKCCIHDSVCNPDSSVLITKDECEKKLCKNILCPGQGEICKLDRYHRAICECPTGCPVNGTTGSEVCGSNDVTYENECEMNMSACVTGDRIAMIYRGPCLPPTTRNPLEICELPKDQGHGKKFELRYFFNKANGICEALIYYGEGGNENNFERYLDCENHCSAAVKDVCVLPKHVGPCRAAFPRWYFNSKRQRCQRFTYGGCLGNGNNFETKIACNERCICGLPKDEGLCLGYFPSWYYNATSGRCEEFVYGGCEGNMNRFHTKERCQKACGSSVDPFGIGLPTPRCNGENKFYCRSVKKCLPVALKCNGVDNCGDNSDEEDCDPCANKKCDFYSTCVTTKNNTAICDCPKICTADRNPVCGSDNETYPNICTMKVESCKKQEMITKTRDGGCNAREKSKCEREKEAQIKKFLLGIYIPQCEEDGSYKQVQCHSSERYCWCVDSEGNKLEETEVRFKTPNCTKDPPVNICNITLCDFGRCVEVDGNATCQCNHACPRNYEPLCGSDNMTYPNLCVLEGEACERKQRIDVRYPGPCNPLPTPTEKPASTTEGPVSICDITLCDFGRCVEIDGNATCQCNHACPRIYEPLCGSDNTTYPNLCVLKGEECERKQRIDVLYPGPCKRKDHCEGVNCSFYAVCVPLENGTTICECPQFCTLEFDPLCGSDGQTYPNTCAMEVTSCKQQKIITKQYEGKCGGDTKVAQDPCRDVECDFYATCVPLQNGSTICECPQICTRELNPVCGSDNETYDNLCLMRVAACERQELITKKYDGVCGLPGRSGTLAATEAPLDLCEISLCEFGRCVVVNGNATCVCNEACPFIEAPVCGSDNKTYANLCVMESEACERKEHVRIKHLGPCGTKSKCKKERDEALSSQREGILIPVCEKDGSYAPKQCEKSSGYCWCVTKQGKKILGTQVRFGEPDCSLVVQPDPCDGVKCDFYATCVALDNGEYMCDCPPFCTEEYSPVCASNGVSYENLCKMKAASCQKQKLWTVESPGECATRPPQSKCEKERATAKASPLLGAFIPQCEEDGSYKQIQCHGSTGFCWCVDTEGNKIEETAVRPHIRTPNCTKVTTSKSKCEKERDAGNDAPLLGAFIPKCEKDGSYKQVQCHSSTGYCWCVDSEGNKVEETAVKFKTPNCTQNVAGGPPSATETPLDLCEISCEFGRCVVVNGNASCVCNEACPFIEAPVCGSDNKTYANLCVMDSEACRRKEHVKVKHLGPCVAPTSAPEISQTKAIPKCNKCPFSGKENVMKSFCDRDNKFAIVGEIVNVSTSGRKISVKVEKRFKPRSGKSKFNLENTVEIAVKKQPKCRCDNLEFKANEKYVLMGRKTRSKVFVIRWKTGFVEKLSDPLVDKLSKKTKIWRFCARKFG